MSLIPYSLSRAILFGMQPEAAHEFTMDMLAKGQNSPLACAWRQTRVDDPITLAGLPPLVGFQAKLSVLQALISAGSAFHVGIAVFAVLMSLIGAYAYLRVVKVMYFDEPTTNEAIRAPWDMRAVLSVNGAMLLVLGIVPGALMTLCARAVVQMLST